jgi:hypothetical protein
MILKQLSPLVLGDSTCITMYILQTMQNTVQLLIWHNSIALNLISLHFMHRIMLFKIPSCDYLNLKMNFVWGESSQKTILHNTKNKDLIFIYSFYCKYFWMWWVFKEKRGIIFFVICSVINFSAVVEGKTGKNTSFHRLWNLHPLLSEYHTLKTFPNGN